MLSLTDNRMSRDALKHDLSRLQREYAIDDSLIESLVASPDQARAHIQFWKRMMWVTNGTGMVLTLGLSVLALRYAARGNSLLFYAGGAICFIVALLCLLTLLRQRKAISEVEKVARQHNLI